MMSRLVAALLMLGIAASADAITLRRCFEPVEPFCQRDASTFRSDWRFQSCRAEVERFRAEVQEFLDCQRRNAREASDALDQVIEAFNCRARGDRFCP
jgi:hypothetical protein